MSPTATRARFNNPLSSACRLGTEARRPGVINWREVGAGALEEDLGSRLVAAAAQNKLNRAMDIDLAVC
jgi:hypothetical protein